MKLIEKIKADLLEHPSAGTPGSYWDVHDKYGVFMSYQSFRDACKGLGLEAPKYRRGVFDALPKETCRDLTLAYMGKRGEFTKADLRDYVQARSDGMGEGLTIVLTKLVRDGLVERIGLGKYRKVDLRELS